MAEDWLPHEPPPQPPRKASARKTFVIWLVLIVMFVAIYALFSGDDAKTAHGAAQAGSGYGAWSLAIAFFGGIAFTILLLVWQLGGSKRFNVSQAPGLEAIAAGDYARAVTVFAELAKRNPTKLNFSATARYNHGYALTRAGNSAAAVGVLLGVERTPKLVASGIRRMAAIELARAFAIGGDVDKASRWLDAAHERVNIGDESRGVAFVDAVHGLVLCRQGKLDEALRHYETAWRRLETHLPIAQMCEAWALRAFALASTSTPRDSGGADRWIAMLRSAPGNELAWLTPHWPELSTFAITHGVLSGRATAA
jgi:tetratricopeptide (TPR) repeat protein